MDRTNEIAGFGLFMDQNWIQQNRASPSPHQISKQQRCRDLTNQLVNAMFRCIYGGHQNGITIFSSTSALEQHLTQDSRGGCRLVPATTNMVCIHFQMEKQEQKTQTSWIASPWNLLAVAISISPQENYVLNIAKLARPLVIRILTTLLEDDRKIKVLFDIRQAACWLHEYGMTRVNMLKCIDLQLAYEAHTGDRCICIDSLTTPQNLQRQANDVVLKILLEYTSPVAEIRSHSPDCDPGVGERSPFVFTPSPLKQFGKPNASRSTTKSSFSDVFPFSSTSVGGLQANSGSERRVLKARSSRIMMNNVYKRNQRREFNASISTAKPDVPLNTSPIAESSDILSKESSATQTAATKSESKVDGDETADPELQSQVDENVSGPIYEKTARDNASEAQEWPFDLKYMSTSLPPAPSSVIKTTAFSSVPDYAEPTRFDSRFATSALTTHWRNQLQATLDYAELLATCQNGRFSGEQIAILLVAAAAYLRGRLQAGASAWSISPGIFASTARRWSNAASNKGLATIVLDAADDYIPRSLELTETNRNNMPPIEISCDIGALHELVPHRFHKQLIRAGDNVSDICFDVGQPSVIIVNGKYLPLDGDLESPVTRDDLEVILTRVQQSIGFAANRASLPSLHRVTTIRASTKNQEVSSVTIRVGRDVRNKALMLSDVLFSKKNQTKSILVLGRPGSGKSSLLRDIARCLSKKTDAVYVVDTWNELGGGTADAHASLCRSRRVMVGSRDEQAAVMHKTIRNHPVRTLIVDEIESDAEISVLQHAKQRGVRFVVGMQGTLTSLVQNEQLNDIVTGEILSLSSVRRYSSIADWVIEVDGSEFGKLKIISGVARAVKSIVTGAPVQYKETRFYNSSTNAICVQY